MAGPKSAAKVATKPEDGWRPSRLIPTTGIGGPDEQEQRATSSLLAVIGAVPQFGRSILELVGAPAGQIKTFTEIRFADEDTRLSIPDGAIVVERGRTRWVALVEVKTAGTELRVEQVERYLDLARTNSFDAVVTISNQITASPEESPISIDARKTKKVSLRHLSWWQVMTQARVEHQHRKISDPDQAWILGELIAYLDHERAGAGGFDDMVSFSAANLMVDARTVRGCVFGSTDPLRDFPRLVRWQERGLLDLERLVSERIGLDDIDEAFGEMLDGKGARSVIVLE